MRLAEYRNREIAVDPGASHDADGRLYGTNEQIIWYL